MNIITEKLMVHFLNRSGQCGFPSLLDPHSRMPTTIKPHWWGYSALLIYSLLADVSYEL